MSFLKKLPLASLLLLLLTYGVFGWLFSSHLSKGFLLLETALVLLIALALTAPLTSLKVCMTAMLRSDLSAFVTVIVVCFAAVVIACWFQVFVRVMVLVSAGALARLDLQTSGHSQVQAFLILAVVSLAGFGLGLMINQLF